MRGVKQILMTAMKSLVKMEVSVKMELIPIHANALKDLKVGPKYISTPERSMVTQWLACLASNHRQSPQCVFNSQSTMLRSCPNMALSVEQGVKPQL